MNASNNTKEGDAGRTGCPIRNMKIEMNLETAPKKSKKKFVFIILAFFLSILFLCVGFVLHKMSKIDSGNKADVIGAGIEKNDIFNDVVEEMNGVAMSPAAETQKDYTTIALFGLDNRSSGKLEKGNSDVIIIASINEKTKEVKLASIYRDTYLNITGDRGFDKCNAAYAYGGPSQAVSMLNVNFDLEIDEYIAFDFTAVANAIDLLGGVEIDLTQEEFSGKYGNIHGYIDEVAELSGKEAIYPKGPGLQTLNGVQATAYARIRYTKGDDFKRTERQRLVIEKMVEKALSSDLGTINNLIDTIFPKIKTSLTSFEILMLAKDVFSYRLGDNAGFPTLENRWAGYVDGKDVVVCCELTDTVKQLHEFLFNETDYEVSREVQELSDKIVKRSGATKENGGRY